MKNNKKIPARAATRNRGRQNEVNKMSFLYLITNMSRRQVRDLIVRAIEDALVLLIIGACIWTICTLAGEILAKMGVG